MSEHSIRLCALNRPLVRLASAFLLGALLAAGPGRAEVVLTGLDDAQSANVLAYLDFDDEPCDAPAWRVEQKFQAAPARIRDALQALGYYEPRIAPKLERDATCWHATFHRRDRRARRRARFRRAARRRGRGRSLVHRGARRIAAARRRSTASRAVRGAEAPLVRSRARARLRRREVRGEPHRRVSRAARRGRDAALRFGQALPLRRRDVRCRTCSTDRLIRSYLPFHPGDSYDARELTDLYIALADSGYFRNIDVRPAAARTAPRAKSRSRSCSRARRAGQMSYGVGLLDGHGPAHPFRPQQPPFQRPRPPVRRQRAAVARRVRGDRELPLPDTATRAPSGWTSTSASRREDTEPPKRQLGARRAARARAARRLDPHADAEPARRGLRGRGPARPRAAR